MTNALGTGDGLMPATYQTAGPTHTAPVAIIPPAPADPLYLEPALDIHGVTFPAEPLHNFCECNCGIPVLRRFAAGHNARTRTRTDRTFE